MELILEPNGHPAAEAYQHVIYKNGIPATVFYSDEFNQEYQQLPGSGVPFKGPPAMDGGIVMAVFDDTVGNWIQSVQV